AYLLGAVPTGLMLARLKGVDIRQVGSGNIGATNVFRSAGKVIGIVTLTLDILKGFGPAWGFVKLAVRCLEQPADPQWGILFGCLAIVGHNWPVYLRFKGGKGVATSAGVLIGIAPVAVGIGLIGFLVLFITTRYISAASIGAAIVCPVAGWIIYGASGLLLPVTLTVLGLLVIVRHRANIQRLLKGEESRFEFGRKKTGEET
ncbi:MAG: glycerol-3-phosphate 1-O-acyltransferase PlsY, partial [Verrucomicrobiota bacterium]